MEVAADLEGRAGEYDEYDWHAEAEVSAARTIRQLVEALGLAIAEADEWHEDSCGRPCIALDKIRHLVD